MTKQTSKQITFAFAIFLILYELVVNMSNDMYTPALPAMLQTFAISTHFSQLTLTVWFAGSMLLTPLIGIYSDNYGRKKVLFVSGIAFILATLVCAVTPEITSFIVARFFQGVAVSGIVVGGYAFIHENLDDRAAINLLAWMTSMLICAPMVGPLLGAIVLLFMSWHWIFILLALAALISLVGLYFTMPTSHESPKKKILWQEELTYYLKIVSHPNF